MAQQVSPIDPAQPEASIDPDRRFDTGHLVGGLKRRTVRGGAVTATSQVIKFVMQMSATAVLARQIAPEEFGLIAMVTAVTGFVAMFKDAGLSMATIQRDKIAHDQVSMLFWINVLLGFLVMVVVALISPLIAMFYDEPRLIGITLLLAGTFLVGGLTVQHLALIRRQMRFKALAVIDIISMFVGLGVAIVLALMDYGYWALAWLVVATTLANCILAWAFSDWRPGRPVRGSGVKEMLVFGGNVTGFSMVNYFARNLDNILIGFYWGAGPLGVYTKAYALLLRPIQQVNAPINAVMAPALSRVQDDTARYTRMGLRLLRMTATFGTPFIALICAMSDEIVLLILGPSWDGAVPVVRWLCVVGVMQVSINQCGSLYLAQGRADLLLRAGLITSLISVASFAVGLPWGPTGVAAAYAISGLLLRWPIMFAFLAKTGKFTMAQLFGAVTPQIVFGLLVMAGALTLRISLEDHLQQWALTLVVFVSVTLIFVLCYSLVPVYKAGFSDGWGEMRSNLIKKKTTS